MLESQREVSTRGIDLANYQREKAGEEREDRLSPKSPVNRKPAGVSFMGQNS